MTRHRQVGSARRLRRRSTCAALMPRSARRGQLRRATRAVPITLAGRVDARQHGGAGVRSRQPMRGATRSGNARWQRQRARYTPRTSSARPPTFPTALARAGRSRAPADVAITAISYYRTFGVARDLTMTQPALYTADGAVLEQCRIPPAFGSPTDLLDSQQPGPVRCSRTSTRPGCSSASFATSSTQALSLAVLAARRSTTAQAYLYSASGHVDGEQSCRPSATSAARCGEEDSSSGTVARHVLAPSDVSGIREHAVQTSAGQTDCFRACSGCDYTQQPPCPQSPVRDAQRRHDARCRRHPYLSTGRHGRGGQQHGRQLAAGRRRQRRAPATTRLDRDRACRVRHDRARLDEPAKSAGSCHRRDRPAVSVPPARRR